MVSLRFLAASTAVVASVATAAEPSPVVKYVYFVPSNIAFDAKAYAGVRQAAVQLAEWNRGQFAGEAPDYKIDYVQGDHTWQWYVYNRDEFNRVNPGSNLTSHQQYIALDLTFYEVVRKLGADPRKDPNLKYYIYTHENAPWDDTQGTGIEGSGFAWASYEDIDLIYNESARAYLGPAHEIGHMWGLPHQGPDSDCMMFGFYDYHCTYSAENMAQILDKHGEFFHGHHGANLGVRDPPATCTAKVGDSCFGSGTVDTRSCCPPESYCHPWSPTDYRCTARPAQCLDQATEYDYFGNDLKMVYVTKPELCCAECAKTAGCKAYTYYSSAQSFASAGACYLKTMAGEMYRRDGAVSGTIVTSEKLKS